MKIIYLYVLIILFFSTALAAETTIRITNGEWEPYMSEYCPYYGFTSHVVSEAFKLEGIKIEWHFFPWRRSLIMAKNGKYWDASCCWWPSEELEQNFYISDAVNESSVVFFHLKNYKFDWKSINELKGLRIGGTFEYEYSTEFMEAMNTQSIYVDLVSKDEQNYRKLKGKRIHIFPNDLIVGYSQIRNNFPPAEAKLFTHHPKELQSTTLNLIITKRGENAKIFINKFNSGLKKLKDSGKFSRMLNDVINGKYDKQKTKWKE